VSVRRRTKLLLKALGVVGFLLLAHFLEKRLHLSKILDPSRVENRLQDAGPLAPVLFMLVMAATVVSPIPTFPLDVLAGRVFGPVYGTLYALTGATLGAMVSFFVARWLGRDLIARFLKGHINFCQQCSDRLLIKVVFLARLIPAVSFDMVSYGSGLTKMSWTKFAAASFVGMLPLTSVYVSFGSVFSISPPVVWLGGAVLVALFFLLPRWIEKYDLFGLSRLFPHRSEFNAE
jgi:uncharacterized membrane protein YdjX (TVP38/TMEM64 family)